MCYHGLNSRCTFIRATRYIHTKDTNAAKPDRIKSKSKHAEKVTFGTGVNLSILERQEEKAKTT